jgi:NADH dehydrogenase FAD-containing subunit
LADGSTVEYDVLAINLGSRTKGTTGENPVGGVWEYSLTTRPINHLLPKIIEKEQQLKAKGVIPDVVVIGGGAAGVELSFAFKARWSKFFGQEIKVQVLGDKETILPGAHPSTIKITMDELRRCGITVRTNCRIKEITAEYVEL